MDFDGRWEPVVTTIGWMVVAGIGAVVVTQVVGYDGFRLLATVQSLTPYLVLLVAVPTAIAAWRASYALAATGALVGISLLALAIPIVFPPDQPRPAEGSTGLRVAAINLLYTNERTDEIADDLSQRELDVIMFSEYTTGHRARLLAHPIADDFPHRVERDGRSAEGVAVWSRYPNTAGTPPDTLNYSVDAMIDAPDGAVRVLAVHPPTPIFNFKGWQRDLALVGDTALSRDEPTLVIGDFNASYWHPGFRRLLDLGLTDAHIATGRGWSTSWPTDEFVPPFVRLDHALTGEGLVSTAVEDFRVPGSDHAGFVVTVAPTG